MMRDMKRFFMLTLAVLLLLAPSVALAANVPDAVAVGEMPTEMTMEEFEKLNQALMEDAMLAPEREAAARRKTIAFAVVLVLVLGGGGFAAFRAVTSTGGQKKGAAAKPERAADRSKPNKG